MQIVHQEEDTFYRDFLPLIAELECGTHYDRTNAQHVAWLRRRIATLYAASAHAICLYGNEGEPVGFLFLQHDPGLENVRCFGRKGTIVMFGLFAPYRSQGLGVQLLREAERSLIERGGEFLYVDTYAANSGAIRFYVRNGFIPVAYHPGENGRGDHGQVYLYKELE
jgi:ribosomal protein S18 acetylase RimI-like enzyme